MAKHRTLNAPDVKRWLPVSVLMAVMLYTGSKSLQYLSVPVFTIFKNLSIILVAYAESKVFGGTVTGLMLVSFSLMVLSSIIAADADFSSTKPKDAPILGYFWMLMNCFSSAAFVVFMRFTMRKMSPSQPFKDFDTVFYNNILTAPMFFVLSFSGADGNLWEAIDYYWTPENHVARNSFILALLFSGISAFWISYASSWCMRVTNSTTYSMVGSLNKLPIAISGLIFFKDTEVTVGSVGSILLGFGAGVIYTIAKLQYDKDQRKKQHLDPPPKDEVDMSSLNKETTPLTSVVVSSNTEKLK